MKSILTTYNSWEVVDEPNPPTEAKELKVFREKDRVAYAAITLLATDHIIHHISDANDAIDA